MKEGPTRFLAEAIDDASLFPPASLPLPAAVEQHLRLTNGPNAWAVNSFSASSRHADDLGPLVESLGQPIDLSFVGRPAPSAKAWAESRASDHRQLAKLVDSSDGLIAIESYEVLIPHSIDLARSFHDLVHMTDGLAFAELPHDWPADDFSEFFAEAADAGIGVKLRCGGTSPQSVPPVEYLARAIAMAAQTEVPIKCTAGLHHAYPHRNEATGDTEYGFLNVIAAYVLAYECEASEREAGLILKESGGLLLKNGGLSWHEHKVDAADACDIQADGLRIGSCSVAEVLEELAQAATQ